jgi:hypothetical protein
MTIDLTTAVATSALAPLHRLDAVTQLVDAFNTAVQDYPARFEGLTGDHLRDLEIAGNEDSAPDRIKALLPVLAEWHDQLTAFEELLTPGDLNLIMSWGQHTSVSVAYRQATSSFDLYARCRDAAHAAWVDWSFTPLSIPHALDADDCDGASDVGDPEPEPCTLDGCDGYGHPEDCTRRLDEVTLTCGLEISTELVSSTTEGTYVSVFGMYGGVAEALNVHAHSRADLDALAADFERAAAMFRRAADAAEVTW